MNRKFTKQKQKRNESIYLNFLLRVSYVLLAKPMTPDYHVIVQEPEILVHHCLWHNFDDPFASALYKETCMELRL